MLSVTINQEVEFKSSPFVNKLLEFLKNEGAGQELEVVIKGAHEDYTFYGEAMRVVNAKYPFRIVCEN